MEWNSGREMELVQRMEKLLSLWVDDLHLKGKKVSLTEAIFVRGQNRSTQWPHNGAYKNRRSAFRTCHNKRTK